MIKKFENFVFEENKGKFKTVDYKIIIKDSKDNPTTLITDFIMVKSEDGKSEVKAKGYIKSDLDGFGWNGGKKKQGWVAFDNNEDGKTTTVRNKHFEDGTKKIKVYEN